MDRGRRRHFRGWSNKCVAGEIPDAIEDGRVIFENASIASNYAVVFGASAFEQRFAQDGKLGFCRSTRLPLYLSSVIKLLSILRLALQLGVYLRLSIPYGLAFRLDCKTPSIINIHKYYLLFNYFQSTSACCLSLSSFDKEPS